MFDYTDSYVLLCALYNRADDQLNNPEPAYDDLMYTLKAQGLLEDARDVFGLCIESHRRVLEQRVNSVQDDKGLEENDDDAVIAS